MVVDQNDRTVLVDRELTWKNEDLQRRFEAMVDDRKFSEAFETCKQIRFQQNNRIKVARPISLTTRKRELWKEFAEDADSLSHITRVSGLNQVESLYVGQEEHIYEYTALKAAEGDYSSRLDELRGVPSCCITTHRYLPSINFDAVRQSEKSEVISESENKIRVFDPVPHLNPLTNKAGYIYDYEFTSIRYLHHPFACSHECTESIRMAHQLEDLLRGNGYGEVADIALEILDKPTVHYYDGSFEVIETPDLKLEIDAGGDTDFTTIYGSDPRT